ncbi:hypothetical protein PoB_006076700 [Plakobranchus ocellatus]|uniref:DUF19 domain-containing protein n=1 Tax=Plakobranchus ocellatus TaxID=259542 RepID=A0AAV4CQW0_9GAST|nr:hypothetical protein PoB_006076700 [Plakobranchus ocellatus]
MNQKGFICLYLLACCCFTFANADQYDGLFCDEKATIFNTLTQRLGSLVNQSDSRVSTICPIFAEYLSHARYTSLTCPNLPLVRNETFEPTVASMTDLFRSNCVDGGYTIKSYGCSTAMVTYLIDTCNKNVDRVQLDLPRHEVCQISKDFIACFEQAQNVCSQDDRLFRERHVPQAVQVTRDTLDYLCDPRLSDVPWENGPSNRRTVRSLDSFPSILSLVLSKTSRGNDTTETDTTGEATGDLPDLIGKETHED